MANSLQASAIALVAVVVPACDGNGALPPNRDPYQATDPEPLDCVPNLDGRIDAAEIPLVLDTEVSFLVSPASTIRTVDLQGATEGDAVRWDWSTDFSDDQLARLSARSIEGKWYADEFPPDAFVAAFDDGGTTESISRQDDRGLYLLGVASTEADPSSGRTLLVYQNAIELIRFPIEPGSQYQQIGVIDNAVFNGLPYAAVDTYDVEVVAIGELALPSFSFTQAHQVRIGLTIEPALGETTSVRQASFFFECFGEVARATSRADETDPNFSEAVELRRIGY